MQEDRKASWTSWWPALLIGVGSFVPRLLLAGSQSYWLDELFSVHQYVELPPTLWAALGELASTSVHPPLYQTLLYGWTALFGTTEIATRTLSNLFVSGAVVVLHRVVHRHHGAAVAHVTAVAFAFSPTAMYYGMETRSYGLTIMLVVLSWWAVPGFLEALRSAPTGRVFWTDSRTMLLSAANVAVLITHFGNAFYWGAQALLVAVLAVRAGAGRPMDRLMRAGMAYLSQATVFLLVATPFMPSPGPWLPRIDGVLPKHDPASILTSVLDRTFTFGPLGPTVGLALLFAGTALLLLRRHGMAIASFSVTDDEHPSVTLSLWMVVVTVLLAYAAFLVLGLERFSSRYYVYLVPHLVLLGVLVARAVGRWLKGWQPVERAGQLIGPTVVPVTIVVALFLFVLPGTVMAVNDHRDDWRGLAADVVAISTSAPDRGYIVYQSAFRSIAMVDHYLERLAPERFPPTTPLLVVEELAGVSFSFEQDFAWIEEHDRLVMVFPHISATQFPRALDVLEARYPVDLAVLDSDGRGWIVFDVSSGARP